MIIDYALFVSYIESNVIYVYYQSTEQDHSNLCGTFFLILIYLDYKKTNKFVIGP